MLFVVTMLVMAAIGFILTSIGVLKASDSPMWDAITVGGMYVWLACTVIGTIVALLVQVIG